MSKSIKTNQRHDEGYKRIKKRKKNKLDSEYSINKELLNLKRPLIFGWFLIIISIVEFVAIVLVIAKTFDANEMYEILAAGGIMLSIPSLKFVGGIRRIKKARRKTKQKLYKNKKFIIIMTVFIFFISSIVVIYVSNIQIGEIEIVSVNQYDIKQKNNKNLVTIKESSITLKCTFNDYLKLWHKKIKNFSNEKEKTYTITYKWNSLFSSKGKIINVQESITEDSN